MSRLAGKVALVMGAGADGPPLDGERLAIGNGRAIAIECARQGAKVMVADLNQAAAQETAEEIRAEGNEAASIQCDVLNVGQCRDAIERTIATFGKLDLLVNNVGITDYADVSGTEVDEFSRILDINVKGHFLAAKFALPQIAKAGGGAILNVSSLSAIRAVAGSGIGYDSSKAALGGLMRNMALSAGPLGIRVNNLLPGFINSPMLRKAAGGVEIDFSGKVPLGRMGTPWDIARVAAFLLSEDASYISGVELCVDGGASVML